MKDKPLTELDRGILEWLAASGAQLDLIEFDALAQTRLNALTRRRLLSIEFAEGGWETVYLTSEGKAACMQVVPNVQDSGASLEPKPTGKTSVKARLRKKGEPPSQEEQEEEQARRDEWLAYVNRAREALDLPPTTYEAITETDKGLVWLYRYESRARDALRQARRRLKKIAERRAELLEGKEL